MNTFGLIVVGLIALMIALAWWRSMPAPSKPKGWQYPPLPTSLLVEDPEVAETGYTDAEYDAIMEEHLSLVGEYDDEDELFITVERRIDP